MTGLSPTASIKNLYLKSYFFFEPIFSTEPGTSFCKSMVDAVLKAIVL